MSTILGRIISFIGAVVCVYITITNIFDLKPNINSDIVLRDSYVDTYYEPSTFNSGTTSINGIYNINHNLIKNGFTLKKSEIDKNCMDLVFCKDDTIYRYYYKYPSGHIIYFSNQYSNSNECILYINEKHY